MTDIDDLKIFLSALGFAPEEGKADIWSKTYPFHNKYAISIDLHAGYIDYGPAIILGDKTTCNFKANENFVVLECVNRLLEKGYRPKSLILEKDFPLGHKTKGKLDILVNDEDEKAYLMIECKTWGIEYERAYKKTIEDGGQILSYYQQDKDVQFLCLYTSRLDGKKIEYKNGVLKIEPEFKLAANASELFSRWNKALKLNGVFEDGVEKYHITPKSYTLNDLDEITQEQSSKIFNQFEEILRRNVISDKPNAFNKFIALLICKIVDEKKRKTEQLEFQWLDDDTPEKLLIRLNDLYRAGMKSYLDKTITDYSDKDIDDEFNHLDLVVRGNIKKMFARMRLEKNNEFAFKEVFDNQTFLDNAVVVKELVQMLEKFKVRYNRKHDYLGAFFELLLNTSLKQEAGQFFTPVPIARFIINSIPLKEMIVGKIKDRRAEDILPYAIDYACGSGHFITEMMDEIQKIINELAGKDEYDDETERTLNSWKADQFKWAEKHIYGIEKDYRLFKTAKVACFLNGDGLANIINADGLASFKWDNEYKDKLSKVSLTDKRENAQFDVLVSNPPYSVSAFRNTIIDKHGAESFELFDRLTSQSSEIECLFIERARQLLKEGGYAGIVLPSSILSNTGIYQDTREMLLKYFKIVAIAEFGSNTFMATGTNTVTLFLQRRNNYDYQRVQNCMEIFYQQGKDLTCNGIENAFSKYVAHVYKTVSLDDYISLMQQKPNETIKAHDLYIDYWKAFENSAATKNLLTKPAFKKLTATETEAELNKLFFEEVLKIEREKLLYFLLTYPQQTLLIKSSPDGKNETEKTFLGYEFSNRRGHAGIKPYGAASIPEATLLFDEHDLLNPAKVNSYIYKAFLGEDITISENLKNHVSQQRLVEMLTFDRVEFAKSISLAVKKKVAVESKWPLVKLDELNILLKRGKSPSFGKSNVEVIKSGQARGFKEFDFTNRYFLKEGIKPDERNLRKGDVLINSTGVGTAGRVTLFELDGDYVVDSHITILRPDTSKVSSKYMLYALSKIGFKAIEAMAQGQSGQIELSLEIIKNIRVPLPPINVQEQIVKEIEEIETIQQNRIDYLNKLRLGIEKVADGLYEKYQTAKLGSVCEIPQYGANESAKRGNPEIDYRYIRITDIDENGELLNDWKTAEKVESQYILREGDFLFARSGATVGKTFLYKNNPPKALFAGYLIRFRTNREKLSPEFLNVIIKSKRYKNWVASIQRKAAQPNINGQEYASFEIPLPDINEQKNIVATIDLLENQIIELKKQLENIPQQTAAILNKYLA